MLLLIGAHSARCNGIEPEAANAVDDLPAVTVERDGERMLQPCAERLLTDEQARGLIYAGLMPLVGHRHRNAVLLPRLQSVADPVVRWQSASSAAEPHPAPQRNV